MFAFGKNLCHPRRSQVQPRQHCWPKGVAVTKQVQLGAGEKPDVLVLSTIVRCLKGEEGSLPEGFGPGDAANFKFSPTANVEVERTFSDYKTVLTDRRHRLTEENVVTIMVAHCSYSPAADC